ncbi:unnamed protein product [Trifolium pratense]|uniref:Uncharacterized protein n=1 Tax=Trifolium pratense TaxID=57577 RepID=A0ACB0K580_TRIPR|nr:unnamed protein product [Trifolium pratense]
MFNWFLTLNTVVLSNNNIVGSLPPSLGKSGVSYLRPDNQRNGLTGPIDVLSSMSNLPQVWLHSNFFTGTIPNMSNCTHLFDLQLQSNFLIGLVPPSLLALSSLKNIFLGNNLLSGPIPVFHKRVKANWEGNNFCRRDVGPCDPQVTILLEILDAFGYPGVLFGKEKHACSEGLFRCQRGKIVSIDLRNKQLMGTISPAFSKLTSLMNLTPANNNLTGSIPVTLTTLPQLQLLDVYNNSLSGRLPKFPSKVKLITRGNVFLGLNISQRLGGGGQNATTSHLGGQSKKATLRAVWIACIYIQLNYNVMEYYSFLYTAYSTLLSAKLITVSMNTLTYESVLYFSILLFMIATVDSINPENYEANYMSDLLKALNPTPMGWSNKTHYCEWEGISCDSSRSVTSIKLPSSSLTGKLPTDIFSLNNLTHIDLHNNSLNGDLPDIRNLLLLQTVSLGHNNFTSVPYYCFQNLQNLRTFNLSNNLKLYPWVFPLSNLASSTTLDSLDLEATNIIGPLDPDTFHSFPNLHTFIISHNKLEGSLPQSLGKSAIRYLRLNDQGGYGFTGTIDVISRMSNLSQAWLHNNSFTDRIPNMSNCTNLSDLQLQSNVLTGLIPPSLLTLPSLRIISLGANMLQGPIPVFHKRVKATLRPNYFCRSDVGPCDPQIMILLEIFEGFRSPNILMPQIISGNNACSTVPIECQREKIVSFEILDFNLTGTISPTFSNLTSLVNLTLAGNSLNGSIPPSLTTLPQLQLLDLSNNNLSGVIPKFSSKVKLNTIGNALLHQNMSRQGGGENATTGGDVQTRGSSKANLRPFWIAGASLISVGFVILIVIICNHKRYPILVQWLISEKNDKFIQR